MKILVIGSLVFLPLALSAQPSRLATEVSKLSQAPLVIEKTAATHVLSEADELARLQAIEGRRLPIQQAPLGDAITVIGTSAEMNFVAPPPSDFPETITLNFQGNPYELLQILGDQYRFTMTYRRGVWVFNRESAGALIGKVYRLKHSNLESVKVGQNTVVTFGRSDNNSSGSSGTNNASGSGLVFEAGESKIVQDLEKLLGLVTTARATIVKEGESLPESNDGRAVTPTANKRSDAGTRVVVVPQTNSLLVVCSRAQHQYVQEYLDSVDRPVRQVHLGAQFVSTSHNPSLVMGIDHSNFQPKVSLSNLEQAINLNKIKTLRAPENALLSANTLSLQLNLLQQDSRSRLEQRASTVASDGSEAAIAVVTEIPYVDSNTSGANLVDGGLGTTRSTVAYRRVGVLINTRMKIFDGENGELPRIRLNLKITVSELSGFIQTGTTSTPQTNSREYTQTVEIPNGYTLALGGLNSEEVNDRYKKIPVLGDIPVLGYLFKSKDKAKQLRSLIGYITPTIVEETQLIKSSAKIQVTSNGNVEAALP